MIWIICCLSVWEARVRPCVSACASRAVTAQISCQRWENKANERVNNVQQLLKRAQSRSYAAQRSRQLPRQQQGLIAGLRLIIYGSNPAEGRARRVYENSMYTRFFFCFFLNIYKGKINKSKTCQLQPKNTQVLSFIFKQEKRFHNKIKINLLASATGRLRIWIILFTKTRCYCSLFMMILCTHLRGI